MVFKHLDFTYAYAFAARAADTVLCGVDADPYIHDSLAEDDLTFVTKIRRPAKITLLHDFVHAVNFSDLDYATGHFEIEAGEDFAGLLASAGAEIPAWLDSDEWPDHVSELDKMLSQAALTVSAAAFHILFADRPFLYAFQKLVAERVRGVDALEFPDAFNRPGVLKRSSHLPVWLKRAVFHRDHGRCQACFTDLTGMLTTNEDIRLDHMLPLALSGTNDPTNFQLLCERCNLEKSAADSFDTQKVHSYW